MKLFKKLALLCTALTLTAGFAALTACGGSGDDNSSSVENTSSVVENSSEESSEEAPATAYAITVLNADGSKAQNVNVQFCIANMCFAPVMVDENGTAVITTPESEYVVHVWAGDMSQEYSLQGNHTVSAYGSYTVQLAE